MTSPSAEAAALARNAGPSLHKLVSGFPADQRLRQSADALVIIGRQLELVMQNQGLEADVAIGTLRFSLFRLHQGRIAQLAPHCRSITVYGEPDVEPPDIAGVEFVALTPGSPLAQEWFLVINSPFFWGALLTQAVAERSNGTVRRYLFEGVLTADERVVSRASLLLSLIQRRPAPEISGHFPLANRAHWAQVAYNLATHSEAERLGLLQSLAGLPDLRDLAALHKQPLEVVLPQVCATLRHHANTAGDVLYRLDNNDLVPVVWSQPTQPSSLSAQSGILGQAITLNEPVLVTLDVNSQEQRLLPEAHAAAAIPLVAYERVWGVLLIGLREVEPEESSAAAAAIGVAALLERLLADRTALPARSTTSQLPTNIAPYSPPDRAPEPPSSNGFGGPRIVPLDEVPLASPKASRGLPETSQGQLAPNSGTNTNDASPTPNGALGTGAVGFGLPSWMRGPTAPQPSRTAVPAVQTPVEPQIDRSWSTLQKRMMGALIAFDQRSAEQIWSEACSMYPTEAICTDLLMPVQIAVGEGWHRGEVSVAAEHFCSRFVEGKLLNLLNAYVDNPGGPLAVIGCAQHEMHELGAIMLSLFMRWSGFRVIYLGQNVPNSTLEDLIRKLRPQIIGLSATTVEAAHNLTEAGQIIQRIEPPRPQLIFGGMAFYERPDLRTRIHGQLLEGDVRQIVRDLATQFRK
ncbi:hypothetical protein HC891_10040 [Candidatus Gracilibacteria bacterium]|nr:hypothetical protein [Candidatus Gracilibacteria bacterium]